MGDSPSSFWCNGCCCRHTKTHFPHEHRLRAPQLVAHFNRTFARSSDLPPLKLGDSVCCKFFKPGHLKRIHNWSEWARGGDPGEAASIEFLGGAGGVLRSGAPSSTSMFASSPPPPLVASPRTSATRSYLAEPMTAAASRTTRSGPISPPTTTWELRSEVDRANAALDRTVRLLRKEQLAKAKLQTERDALEDELEQERSRFTNGWTYEALKESDMLKTWLNVDEATFEWLYNELLLPDWEKHDYRQRYTLRDKLVWTLLVGSANFDYATINKLFYGKKQNAGWIRRTVKLVARVMSGTVVRKGFIGFPSLGDWAEKCWPMHNRNKFLEYLVLIGDGSGTRLYKSVDIRLRKLSFCYWKALEQLRWTIVSCPDGYIACVTDSYFGKRADDIILDNDYVGLYDKLRKAYDIDKEWHDVGAGLRYKLAFGGDAGYTRVPTSGTPGSKDLQHFGKMTIIITLSGVESTDPKERTTFKRNHPQHIFHKEFNEFRCVVERVIGRVQAYSKFIVGPIHLKQADLLNHFLVIYSAIVNRELASSPEFFVKAKEQAEEEAEEKEYED